ncbi:MAG: sugar phosphate nucleotidyltransferase [Candidatus Omnitrophota bacterium]
MNNTYAVFLAGGKGTRLWPLSTPNFSKSFVSIENKKPLIEESINRLKGVIPKKNIIIVVDKAQKKHLKKFVKGIPSGNILVEPFGRSTASAVGLAAIKLKPDDVMLILPTDAMIENPLGFKNALKKGINFAKKPQPSLICVGIKPREPKTAYGYINIGPSSKSGVYPIRRFIEKPKRNLALKLIKNPSNLWNAGMFIFKVKDILEAIKKHAPLLYRELKVIKKSKKKIIQAYSRMKNVSIDYQIMEKANNLFCVKGDFCWRDLGSWKSVGEFLKHDKLGNASFGNLKLIDAKGSIVYNTQKKYVGVAGLKDIVVINTENGVLICRKQDTERVKELANKIEVK